MALICTGSASASASLSFFLKTTVFATVGASGARKALAPWLGGLGGGACCAAYVVLPGPLRSAVFCLGLMRYAVRRVLKAVSGSIKYVQQAGHGAKFGFWHATASRRSEPLQRPQETLFCDRRALLVGRRRGFSLRSGQRAR